MNKTKAQEKRWTDANLKAVRNSVKKEIMTKLVTMSDTNCKIDLDQAIKAIK